MVVVVGTGIGHCLQYSTVATVDVGLDNDLRFGIGTGWTGYAGKHGPFHQVHNSI